MEQLFESNFDMIKGSKKKKENNNFKEDTIEAGGEDD